MNGNRWFPFLKKNKGCEVCLFCFHHAGGSAATFREWVWWSEKVNIYPVELPGKGTRLDESFIDDMETLTPLIAKQVSAAGQGQKVFLYGHSMGAAIAFKVGMEIARSHEVGVEKLLVSGRQPPHFPNTDRYHSGMGNDALVTELKRLNGTPKEFLESAELLNYIVPQIRFDYILNESFCYKDEIADFPIVAFAGSEDEDAGYEIMKHWQEVSRFPAIVSEEAGDHFFPFQLKREFFDKLEREIV